MILSSNDSNGFTFLKIICFKQRFLILFLTLPCFAYTLHLSLSLSLSLIQIVVRSAPTNCSNYTLIFTSLWISSASHSGSYRRRHCLPYNRSTCHWGEGRDIQTRSRGGLANHNILGQLTDLTPSLISEGGASEDQEIIKAFIREGTERCGVKVNYVQNYVFFFFLTKHEHVFDCTP